MIPALDSTDPDLASRTRDPARGDELLLNHQQLRRGETIVKTLKTLVGALASAALLGSALAIKPAFGADIVLRMAVPDWPPTRTM